MVLAGDRSKMEQEQLNGFFWPVTGKWQMRDLHKTFVDEESFNSGHGHCYDHFGIDPQEGAVLIVRPDNYVSKVTTLDDYEGVGDFFTGFVKRPVQMNGVSIYR